MFTVVPIFRIASCNTSAFPGSGCFPFEALRRTIYSPLRATILVCSASSIWHGPYTNDKIPYNDIYYARIINETWRIEYLPEANCSLIANVIDSNNECHTLCSLGMSRFDGPSSIRYGNGTSPRASKTIIPEFTKRFPIGSISIDVDQDNIPHIPPNANSKYVY